MDIRKSVSQTEIGIVSVAEMLANYGYLPQQFKQMFVRDCNDQVDALAQEAKIAEAVISALLEGAPEFKNEYRPLAAAIVLCNLINEIKVGGIISTFGMNLHSAARAEFGWSEGYGMTVFTSSRAKELSGHAHTIQVSH